MRELEAYKTSDGQLFEDYDKAETHQMALIGEKLDGMLPHDDRGNVTQADRFNILTKMLADTQALHKKIKDLDYALHCLDD